MLCAIKSPPTTHSDASTMLPSRVECPLPHDLVHRGDRAGRAALDRVAHEAGADRGNAGTRHS